MISPTFDQFFGRFHPVLVHLPIGFLVVAAALEVLAKRPRFKELRAAVRTILVLAALAAWPSAACGWLLAGAGDYDARLLLWHRWSGIALAVLATALPLLRGRTYGAGLVLMLATLAVAGHLGGSLTHGADYLTRYAPAFVRKWMGAGATAAPMPQAAGNPMEREIFSGILQPIVNRYCVGCHGPEKTKANLRMDSYEAMLLGGKHGPVFTPGNAAKSVMMHFTGLPLEDDDHMPPAGKPQPSADELVIVKWWINAGAPTNHTVAQLNPPSEIQRAIEALLKNTPP